jgi:reactive intermediate/imine deaminase
VVFVDVETLVADNGAQSQAIKTPTTIYCSGQIPLKPDGTFVEGTIAEKTEQCCKNVKAVVEAAGSSMSKVVKTTVFLSDMAHFAVRYLKLARGVNN